MYYSLQVVRTITGVKISLPQLTITALDIIPPYRYLLTPVHSDMCRELYYVLLTYCQKNPLLLC